MKRYQIDPLPTEKNTLKKPSLVRVKTPTTVPCATF